MSKKNMKPESLMMSHGYDPVLSQGAVKCPIFQTSTFMFNSAEEGKAFFEVAYGLREQGPNEKIGLIYSRLNNPDLEILENRLCLWDGAEDAAVFESGMSAISTALLEFLSPGDLLVHSGPLYGGTDHFIHYVLKRFDIQALGFKSGTDKQEMMNVISAHPRSARLRMMLIETPANPTNSMFDISLWADVANEFSRGEKVVLAVDNTYMGPLWQHPLKHGADLVLYSATKYIGGHSDVIAGACLGSKKLLARVKTLRTFFGNMAGPWTGWLLMRSLETIKVRMERQAQNARLVAEFLQNHKKVEKVYYLGFTDPADKVQYEIYQKQYESDGAMISFDIIGGEKEAFSFLNNLKLIKLAVSLGGTESLAEHPATMTHADVDAEDRKALSISDKLIRLSIGVEAPEDLIWDIGQSLDKT